MTQQNIAFRQSIKLALASQIGDHGLSSEALELAFSAVERALSQLSTMIDEGELALVSVANDIGDLPIIRDAALQLLSGGPVTDIVFLGTGGSSLGAQALAQLAFHQVAGLGRLDQPRLHFFDNLDPDTFSLTLDRLPLASTRIVAISKSGSTGETLIQTIILLSKLEKAGLRNQVSKLFLGLSETRKSGMPHPLRDLLEPEGVIFLEHHPAIGGRYSVLSNVGLLPAALLGLNTKAIREGAQEVIKSLQWRDTRSIPAVAGAAINVAAHNEGKNIAVLMAYTDRLERFTKWWIQLWAESLGKKGFGSQPVSALGPVDQHSQQQLYLDGPRDKLFTVITLDAKGTGARIDEALAKRAGQISFAGKSVGDFVSAQGLAMIDTFAHNGRPVRQIILSRLDERGLGALFMHFMLETILTGFSLGVNPFDQPAVEEAKLLAKQYLAEGRG